MDEAIAAKYDAIVVSPISMTANNLSIAKARAAGIPVLELANDSPQRRAGAEGHHLAAQHGHGGDPLGHP